MCGMEVHRGHPLCTLGYLVCLIFFLRILDICLDIDVSWCHDIVVSQTDDIFAHESRIQSSIVVDDPHLGSVAFVDVQLQPLQVVLLVFGIQVLITLVKDTWILFRVHGDL